MFGAVPVYHWLPRLVWRGALAYDRSLRMHGVEGAQHTGSSAGSLSLTKHGIQPSVSIWQPVAIPGCSASYNTKIWILWRYVMTIPDPSGDAAVPGQYWKGEEREGLAFVFDLKVCARANSSPRALITTKANNPPCVILKLIATASEEVHYTTPCSNVWLCQTRDDENLNFEKSRLLLYFISLSNFGHTSTFYSLKCLSFSFVEYQEKPGIWAKLRFMAWKAVSQNLLCYVLAETIDGMKRFSAILAKCATCKSCSHWPVDYLCFWYRQGA